MSISWRNYVIKEFINLQIDDKKKWIKLSHASKYVSKQRTVLNYISNSHCVNCYFEDETKFAQRSIVKIPSWLMN